ncbi:MAG: CDP-diacylglycerol--serine O-phosphatidyltransferase [Bacteroidales bacterium]|nr:CDP-diacylglycerol--serine O-phosphatidyltransferase [Bacteroidales bacterium]
MSLRQYIPNAITCCNLISGCFSILFSFSGMPVMASVMIFAAGLFDFFDGFTARLLNAHSPIGGDLDSLSDVVSFGVAPGFIMYHVMCSGMVEPIWPLGEISLFACFAFLLPVFSAVRLAKFNVDTRQTTSFIGLPTPPMAIFMASLPLAFWQLELLDQPVLNPYLCLGIVILFSVMMVCNLHFFSFKMKSVSWKGNEVRWIFLIIAIVGFAVFRFVALPFILLAYILMSVLFYKG